MKKAKKKGTPSAKTLRGRRSAPSKKPFRLEVGKTYITRSGEVVGPMKWTSRSRWKAAKERYPLTDGSSLWTSDGAYWLGQLSPEDLIREVKSPKGRGK